MSGRRGGRRAGDGGDANHASEERLDSVDAVRRRVPGIVKQVNADPQLALRAAANPLLALQELGYEIPDDVQGELALLIRFDKQKIATLQKLASRIHELAGTPFDIDSTAQLRDVLFDRLKLQPLPATAQRLVVAPGRLAARSSQRAPSPAPDPIAVPYAPPGSVRRPDPLEGLRTSHPIIEPLLEYRAIQASAAPLASRDVYDRLKGGEAATPDIRIRAVLRRGHTPS